MWWALMEEIAPHAACEKEMACCVRGYIPHIQGYSYGQQQLGKCWCVAGSQPMRTKLFIVFA